MILTNRKKLPEAIVRAVANDPYPKGIKGLSVTTLVAPAYQRRLMREHWNEIKEDVSDRIWSLIGQAAHVVLERAAGQDDVVERRLFTTIEVDGKEVKIHGQVDLLAGDLVDYKITSVWSILDAQKNGKPEWEAQLNLLKWLAEANGLKVNGMKVIAIARDWSKRRAKEGNYPDQVEVIEIAPIPKDALEVWLHDRVREHLSDSPAPCSPEERWTKPTTYAVKRKGRKTALRVLESMDEAETWKAQNAPDGFIEVRQGEDVRCADYCSVNKWCEYWRSKCEK